MVGEDFAVLQSEIPDLASKSKFATKLGTAEGITVRHKTHGLGMVGTKWVQSVTKRHFLAVANHGVRCPNIVRGTHPKIEREFYESNSKLWVLGNGSQSGRPTQRLNNHGLAT